MIIARACGVPLRAFATSRQIEWDPHVIDAGIVTAAKRHEVSDNENSDMY